MDCRNKVRITLRYQVATYSGEITVLCHEDTDSDTVKALARGQLRRKAGGSLPLGYESYNEISREYVNEND